MNAEEYITQHYRPREIWENLSAEHHRVRFAEIARLVEGETHLDVGCAFGHSTNILHKLTNGTWTGADESISAIREARKLFPRYMFYYYEKNLPFADQQFDTVVCAEVIEHVDNDMELVDELKRIARLRVILTTPARKVNDPGHLRMYTKEMLKGIGMTPHKCGRFWFAVWDRE